MPKQRTVSIKPTKISRPYFGRKDLTSDDKYGRALNNYAKKSPYGVTPNPQSSIIKRGK